MCAIFGFLTNGKGNLTDTFDTVIRRSKLRGRDGFGWKAIYEDGIAKYKNYKDHSLHSLPKNKSLINAIGNFRAEPTNEYVSVKHEYDQQPYSINNVSIVHNGVISNDKAIRSYELSTKIDSAAIAEIIHKHKYEPFKNVIEKLVGSYAVLFQDSNKPYELAFACNYKPIWYCEDEAGLYIASSEMCFPSELRPVMVEPYSVGTFSYKDNKLVIKKQSLRKKLPSLKTLVVTSGGLDSTVAAVRCIKEYDKIELLYFSYGCRAEDREMQAVENIAKHLDVKYNIFEMGIYNKSDSTLFNGNISKNETGVEYAYEWVPARNLVMLSIATAYAEANGFNCIALGNNLEEAGAYPDNEPEFIYRFNAILPFSVNNGIDIKVTMPVGYLMKHEIVKLGKEIEAPMHLTWSCYDNKKKHCGKCAPCFMRKTAFEINNIKDSIEYDC